MDQIADGIDRLSSAVKRLKAPSAEATTAKSTLKRLLASVEDERARSALAEVRKHKPNLELLSKIATGAAPDELGAQLRALAEINIPDEAATDLAAQELLAAVEELALVGGARATRADARSNLLEQALALHADHGDQDCPVCGVGALDSSWRDRVAFQLAAEQAELAAVRAAQQKLTGSRQAARAQVAVPEVPALTDKLELASLSEAGAALKDWRDVPASDIELARHLTSRVSSIVRVFVQLRDEAAAELSGRDDSWRSVAQQIAAWLQLKRSADEVSADFADVNAASGWLKDNAETLRNQRLEPLADEARKIWTKLRQESSIDLDAITLSGQRNRGRVNLKARVDGVATEALPVMSHGELNAIALALFLPRATMAASPLQFAVLDDPVQAMDPAKVDGLADVLIEYAKQRQVVVFTHDDRLAESVRRTAPKARIVQVERGAHSKVEVTECQSPALRYLEDARDLWQDKSLSAEVLGKAFPGYARLAVEAAAHQVYFRRQLTRGVNRHTVETVWNEAMKTRERIALALHDDKKKDLRSWSQHGHRQRTLTLCGPGVHHGLKSNAADALADLGKTVDDLLGSRP